MIIGTLIRLRYSFLNHAVSLVLVNDIVGFNLGSFPFESKFLVLFILTFSGQHEFEISKNCKRSVWWLTTTYARPDNIPTRFLVETSSPEAGIRVGDRSGITVHLRCSTSRLSSVPQRFGEPEGRPPSACFLRLLKPQVCCNTFLYLSQSLFLFSACQWHCSQTGLDAEGSNEREKMRGKHCSSKDRLSRGTPSITLDKPTPKRRREVATRLQKENHNAPLEKPLFIFAVEKDSGW